MRIILFILFFPLIVSGQKTCITPPRDLNKSEPLKAFGDIGKFWKGRDTFYVYFIDHPEEKKLQKRIMYRANKWGRNVSKIRFIQTNNINKADVRISLSSGGSWSYVGTDNKYIPINEPTMLLGWAIGATGKELTRVVVHEFGHFLGLGHEHNHPTNSIKWNYDAVYRDYSNWTKEEVNNNVFKKYSTNYTNFTEYDSKSIMHYPILSHHTLDGYSVGLNDKLSNRDKIFITTIYGK